MESAGFSRRRSPLFPESLSGMHLTRIRLSTLWLCAVVIVVWAAAMRAAPQLSTTPRALVPNLSHDFGIVEQGSKVAHEFSIQNGGTAPLILMRVSMSAPGMTARMRRSIPPGEQATVTVEWTASVKGPFEGKAVLEVNDPARPEITFSMTAMVEPAIEIVPYQAVYASVYAGEVGRRTLRIVNRRARPLTISRVERQGDHFEAAITPVESGKLYELTVSVPAATAPGRYSEAVFLYTDDPAMPRLMVPVNVLVKTELYANPETIDFGRVALKEVTNNPSLLDLLLQTLMVRKRVGRFSITSATSDVPFVTVRRSPDGEVSSEAFRIDLALDKDRLRPGPFSGKISVRTDDTQFPEVTVPVRGEIQ